MSHLYLARALGNHHFVAVGRDLSKEGACQVTMRTVRGRVVLIDQASGRCFGGQRCGRVGGVVKRPGQSLLGGGCGSCLVVMYYWCLFGGPYLCLQLLFE